MYGTPFFLPQIAVIFQCSHSLERYLECGIKIMWKCRSELVIIDLLHHTEIPLVFLFLLPWAVIMESSCQSVDIIFPAVPSGSLALEVVLASLLFPLIFCQMLVHWWEVFCEWVLISSCPRWVLFFIGFVGDHFFCF